ncbi:DUF2087 domain-containing protein [Streptomyces glaucosporus]
MDSSDGLVRLLAEPARLRAFAALVLGAGDVPAVAAATGLSVKDAAVAVRRLRDGGLVSGGNGGDGDGGDGGNSGNGGDGLRVADGRLKELARTAGSAAREAAGRRTAADPLHAFVHDGRIVHLPARKGRRRPVLERVAAESFEPGRVYAEREVDDRLRTWCEGGATDHVTVRRYLIDECLLTRENGRYWLTRH